MTIYNSTKVLPYVYQLTHKETGQFYIGYRCSNKEPSTNDLGYDYFTSSKYVKNLGFDNFDLMIIAEFFTKNAAIEFETQLITENWKHPLNLNKNLGGIKFTTTGISIPWTDKMKYKNSLSHKGIKRGPLSNECKEKISISKQGQQPWLGLKHSAKTILTFSEIAKNRSPETKEKMKTSLRNYYEVNGVSQEIRDKISKANTGKVRNEETRERMGLWQRGKPKSEKHALKLREAQLSTYILENVDGAIIKVRCNFRKYCKEHKLSERILLRSLITKEFNNGWRLISKNKSPLL